MLFSVNWDDFVNIAQAAADFLLRQRYRAEMYTHFPLRFMLTFLSLVLVSFSIANLKHLKKKKNNCESAYKNIESAFILCTYGFMVYFL